MVPEVTSRYRKQQPLEASSVNDRNQPRADAYQRMHQVSLPNRLTLKECRRWQTRTTRGLQATCARMIPTSLGCSGLAGSVFTPAGRKMHNVQFEISKPTEDGAFEDMCARIYVTVFNDPLPQTNGRRGQKQGGIDVFVDAPEGRLGVQCKKYADGALKFKHVEHEVSEADKANAPIVRLIVATTAMSDVVHLRKCRT